ncbi:MAG TPA: hypothetical protein VHO29_01420 [Marmoricola sp.]|nr:hypothetical protein [Marmoricola sp.]
MPMTRQGRLTALVASAALASGGLLLAVPAATAAPVFTDANTNLDPGSGAYSGGGTCAVSTTPGANTTVPVVENGGSATASGSMTASYTNSGDGTDTATGTATDTATGSVTSVGGTLKSMDFTGSGAVNLDQALATSACDRSLYAYVDLDFNFTLTQPGYLHVQMSNAGPASYGEVDIWQVHATGDQPYVDHFGHGLKFNGTDDVFLPAGEYRGYFESQAWSGDRTTDFAGTGTTTVHASFSVAGSQTAAQTGKGHRYVGFAAARTCATHSLGATVTHRKKLAHRIKKISFFVNGTKVRTLRHPHRSQAVSLTIADDQTADVLAKVKLTNGKVLRTTASYEACS